MSTVATPVISIRFDERPNEWRTIVHPTGVDELVEQILTEPPSDAPAWVRGHREIHLGDEPYDPLHPQLAPMLLLVVAGGCGAAYFRDLNVDDGSPLGFIARGDEQVVDPPPLTLNGQGSIRFEPADALTRDRLREIVRDYLVSGERPATVTWRYSEWVL